MLLTTCPAYCSLECIRKKGLGLINLRCACANILVDISKVAGQVLHEMQGSARTLAVHDHYVIDSIPVAREMTTHLNRRQLGRLVGEWKSDTPDTIDTQACVQATQNAYRKDESARELVSVF
jgi:hypothetical protein